MVGVFTLGKKNDKEGDILGKNQKVSKMNNRELLDHTPILIPSESVIEGYIKTRKSFRIECNYFGTIMSSQKVVIGKTSKITGDI